MYFNLSFQRSVRLSTSPQNLWKLTAGKLTTVQKSLSGVKCNTLIELEEEVTTNFPISANDTDFACVFIVIHKLVQTFSQNLSYSHQQLECINWTWERSFILFFHFFLFLNLIFAKNVLYFSRILLLNQLFLREKSFRWFPCKMTFC